MASTSTWTVGCSPGSSRFYGCCVELYRWLRVECLGYVCGLDGCLSGGGDLLSGRLG
jgi:hypothetical protein